MKDGLLEGDARNPCEMQLSSAPKRGAFVKADEAAAAIPVPVRTLEKWTRNGVIPSYKLGRHRLYRIEEVIAAIEATRTASIREVLR